MDMEIKPGHKNVIKGTPKISIKSTGFTQFCARKLWPVFMGDTGSLALGGAFATLAICSKHEAVLIIVGGVFVMEAASVILQVASCKLRGKRIFECSPIHHHFEFKGCHESQVVVRFWMLSLLCALFGLATLKLR